MDDDVEEIELTVTLVTNPEGFSKIADYVSKKYPSKLVYETSIRYNDITVSENERLRRKYTCEENHEYSSFYRVVISGEKTGDTIPFTEIEKYVIPENTVIRKGDNNGDEPNDTVAPLIESRVNRTFQKKTHLRDFCEIFPYTLSLTNLFTKEILVACTWKHSKEKYLDENIFESIVLANINDTDGSFVPKFGQQRCCIYGIDDTDIRFSIGKAFEFGGVQEGRRPMNEFYYIEFEKELIDEADKRSCVLKKMRKFVKESLEMLPQDLLYNIMLGANDICVGEENRVAELLDDYNRIFTHDFEKIKSKIRYSSMPRTMKNVYLAPKWDGIRGIGVWDKGRLIIRTRKALREFTLPSYCVQRLVVQVEMFINDDDMTLDNFVVTEIFGVSLCGRKQLYGYFYKNASKQHHFHGNHFKLADTFTPLHPSHSMELIMKFHKKNPANFTHYSKCEKFRDLKKWFFSKKRIPLQAHHLPTDGMLGIVVYDKGKSSMYVKLKNNHTIELEYDVVKQTLKTADNNRNLMTENIEILGIEDTKSLYWFNTCIDSTKVIVEFEIIVSDDINNSESDYEDELLNLLQKVKLRKTKIRYDKFIADTDNKIHSIVKNLLLAVQLK